jgi:hypothetical protein
MSTRERWIVYPLLFMILGITMRDKVVPPSHIEAGCITSPQIRCNELQTGQVRCDRLEARQAESHTMLVTGPNGQPVVVAGIDANTGAGVVETYAANGLRQVRLFSSETGGVVTTIERSGRMALILGDTGQNFGVFAEVPSLGQLIPLTLPWRIENKPGGLKPSTKTTTPDHQEKVPSGSRHE